MLILFPQTKFQKQKTSLETSRTNLTKLKTPKTRVKHLPDPPTLWTKAKPRPLNFKTTLESWPPTHHQSNNSTQSWCLTAQLWATRPKISGQHSVIWAWCWDSWTMLSLSCRLKSCSYCCRYFLTWDSQSPLSQSCFYWRSNWLKWEQSASRSFRLKIYRSRPQLINRKSRMLHLHKSHKLLVKQRMKVQELKRRSKSKLPS